MKAWSRALQEAQKMVRTSWAVSRINWELERAWWGLLRIQLPAEGIAARFQDEAACLERLVEQRWGKHVSCPRCGMGRPFNVPAVARWQCRECRHQFSATSGTMLGYSKLPLRTWFLSADYMIRHAPAYVHHLMPPLEEYAAWTGLHHNTASRLRRRTYDDLRTNGGQGFLGKLVLVNPVKPPADTTPDSPDFLVWLRKEAEDRSIPLEI
jgi:transposase-like protein